MRCEFWYPMLGLVLSAVVSGSASAQSCGNGYDFNSLAGNDTAPFTPLDGQDGWTAESYNTGTLCGVTATLGFDGTPALRFQAVGPGYGCDASRLNDGTYTIPTFMGNETSAFYQVDFGVGYWGESSGVAYDVDGNGKVRGSEPGERGPRLSIGSHANVGVGLVTAAGNTYNVPIATVGGGGDWIRLRLAMDFTANGGTGSGSVDYMNLTNGETDWTPVAGLQDIDLDLSPGSGDAADPTNWNGVWLHFEGATNQLDNIDVGLRTCTLGEAYCPGDGVAPHTLCPCANNNDGSMGGCDWGDLAYPGGGVLSGSGTASMAANDAYLHADGIENNFGIFFGAANQVNGGNGNPLNDGLRCAGGALVRLIPPTMATGNQAMTPAPLQTLDTGAASGVTRRYQYWFRTPSGPCGQMANLTNGYEIVWMP